MPVALRRIEQREIVLLEFDIFVVRLCFRVAK